MPIFKKKIFKRRAKKGVTKAQVTAMIKRSDPNALPKFSSIFRNFGKKILRIKALQDLVGGQPNYIGSLAGVAGAPQASYGSFSFTLGQLDISAALSTLYDQYRILGVDITFKPQYNVDQANTVNSFLGELLTVIDYDDATVPSSITTLRAYESVVVSNTMTKQHRRFVPKMALAAYSGSLFNAFANQSGQWLDLASSSIPHYGIKWALTGSPSTNITAYSVEWYVMLELKSIR